MSTVRDLGLLKRRHGYYWTRIGLVLAALGGVITGFILLGDSWFQLLMAGALAAVLVQVAFLSHDSAHRQMFHWARTPTSRSASSLSPPTTLPAGPAW